MYIIKKKVTIILVCLLILQAQSTSVFADDDFGTSVETEFQDESVAGTSSPEETQDERDGSSGNGVVSFPDENHDYSDTSSSGETQDKRDDLSGNGVVSFPDENHDYSEVRDDVISVLLPCEIPFDIVILGDLGYGIVNSDDFKIINSGDNDITVEILSAYIEIDNDEDFFISEVADLPQDRNNIYIELTCSDNDSSTSSVLTNKPIDVAYEFNLAAGEEGLFKLTGFANEYGDIPWSDASVRAYVCYNIVGLKDDADGLENFPSDGIIEEEIEKPIEETEDQMEDVQEEEISEPEDGELEDDESGEPEEPGNSAPEEDKKEDLVENGIGEQPDSDFSERASTDTDSDTTQNSGDGDSDPQASTDKP